MSDLRRQNASLRNRLDAALAENQALRHIIGDIPPEYATALAALCDLAYHGCRRPDDLGGTIMAGHASSRPPNHNPIAYHHRNEERRHLRARSVRVWTTVERLVDGPTVVGHHTSAQTA